MNPTKTEYALTEADRAIVESVCRDVPEDKVEAIRKIHRDALRGHEKRRSSMRRELAALDRATAMRAACLDLLREST